MRRGVLILIDALARIVPAARRVAWRDQWHVELWHYDRWLARHEPPAVALMRGAALACGLPAQRAARLDPITALRRD